MKLIRLLLIALLFVAYGCNDDIPDIEPITKEASLKNGEIDQMVPITGKCFVTIEEYNEQGLGIAGTMSGVYTHLGKLRESESTWTNESHTLSYPLLYYVHQLVACAANGDLMYGTYSGSINVETLEAEAYWDIDGGTGRFRNVSGYMNVHGYAQRDESGKTTGSYLEGEGEMTIVGTLRKKYIKAID